MNWDEFEDGSFLEFIKFDEVKEKEDVIYDIVSSLYIKPNWKSLSEYTNDWGKKRHFIECLKIKVYPLGMNVNPSVMTDIVYKLDMGKRLLRAMRDVDLVNSKRPRYVKILRIGEGFDTHYYVKEYKIVSQQLIVPPKKKAGRPKKQD